MANEKRIAEAKVSYQALTDDLSEPIIIERDGLPIAVVVAYAEFEELKAARADNARRREEAFQHMDALLAEVHARPTDLTPEEIESEITEAVREVREERNARLRRD